MALDAGEFKKAKASAKELLTEAARLKTQSGSLRLTAENQIYKAHQILGRVALREGSLSEARKQLLESANITPGPGLGSLSSFGPNMTLAKELLEKGEKKTVLEFFERCRKFWSTDREKLDAWSWQVSQGKIPDFGANLLYQ